MADHWVLAATLIVAVLTFLPAWRFEAWWVRALDFPRLQLFLAAAIVLALQLFPGDWAEPERWLGIAVALACVGYQVWWILPYTRLFPVEVASSRGEAGEGEVRFIIANVLTSNRNAGALLEMVRRHRPDILVTLESDRWWQERLDELQADYPYTIQCPQDNLYGMHVYSRLPLSACATEFLVEDDVPSMQAIATLPSGRRVWLNFVHPAPPSPPESDSSSERDAELVLVGRRVADSKLPVVVSGDLNDVAWSETTRLFRKISDLLDPRVGRGMFNTFHAKYWLLRWPLDHVFHSHHFTLGGIKRLPSFGSDHFPLLFTLVLQSGRQGEDDGLEAEPEDRARAEEKLE